MVVGYVRPSEEDPECKIQLQTLARSGYDHLYREEHSSPKRRVALQKLLSEVQPGDTIVVAKLFSFADSTGI